MQQHIEFKAELTIDSIKGLMKFIENFERKRLECGSRFEQIADQFEQGANPVPRVASKIEAFTYGRLPCTDVAFWLK